MMSDVTPTQSCIVGVLNNLGLCIPIKKILDKYGPNTLQKLKNKYTIRVKVELTNTYKSIHLYNVFRDKGYICFPKFSTSYLFKKGIIQDLENHLIDGESVDYRYTGKSNSNQVVIINYLLNHYFASNTFGLYGVTLKVRAGCHAKDTDILMFDGTIKKVQDITINDLLMGDDSTPRKVIKLIRGEAQMYGITNKKGESYIVNGDHILCLKYANKNTIRYNKKYECFLSIWFDKNEIKVRQKRFKTKSEAELFMSTIIEDYIVEISVNDYLKLSKTLQKKLKEYKVKIEYPQKDMPIDPYIIGYWLVDEHSDTSVISTQDSAVLKYFSSKLGDYNWYRINELGDSKIRSNSFNNSLLDLNLIKNKHIPDIYKFNSRDNRLLLLAGLLDSVGSLTQDKASFEFYQCVDNEKLFDDVLYLARSLGFSCYKKHKRVKKEECYTMTISGSNIDEIPTLCLRKKANPRRQIKDALVSQISIKPLEIDNYYGFQVDKNNRYVMGSFTVTHNCGKTYIAMDIISRLKRKTLIVVPNTYMLNQWVELLTMYFPDNEIGTLYSKEHKDGDIIVAIINSASQLDEFKIGDDITDNIHIIDLFKSVGLVIFDESHMYISKIFRKVYFRVFSKYIIGLTATPDEKKYNQDYIHLCNVGPVLDAETIPQYKKDDDKFISDVHIIKYNAHEDYTKVKLTSAGILDYNHLLTMLIEDPYRNIFIINSIFKLMEDSLNVYIFSDRRQHLELLYKLMRERAKYSDKKFKISVPELKLSSMVLYGGSTSKHIEQAKNVSNVIFTTYQYSSTGISIVKMNSLILATPRRSNMTQIINRIFRLGSDQTKKRIIIDIVDNKTRIKGQYRARQEAYVARECNIITDIVNYTDIDLDSSNLSVEL